MKTNRPIYNLLLLVALMYFLLSCKKEAAKVLPTVTTSAVTNIIANSVTTGGDITTDGGSQIIARGVCWSTSQNPTISNDKTSDGIGSGIFTSYITGLTPNKTYYIRAYSTNSVGTSYGNQLITLTLAALATLSTTAISNITTTTASSGVSIIDDGSSVNLSLGICWSTSPNPTISNSKTIDSGFGTYVFKITGLSAGTTYYVRAYSTNKIGTSYGNQITFTTIPPSITDNDGNTYNTLTISTQVWLKENLKTTKYNDGTAIPLVTNNTVWAALITPAYCWYNNDIATNKNTYGALYNWYTVNTGKLCPSGWHVPSTTEWVTLTSALTAGGQLKEVGTTHWLSPNTGANNKSGFTALPGGHRFHDDGLFTDIGYQGSWWSSTEVTAGTLRTNAHSFDVSWQSAIEFYTQNPKGSGLSVRCVKD